MPKTPEQIRAKQREANVSRLLAMLQHYIKRIEDDEGEISKNIREIDDIREQLRGYGYDLETGELMPFRAWTTQKNEQNNGI